MAITKQKLLELKKRFKFRHETQDKYWLERWKENADYILPNHGRFLTDGTMEPSSGKNRHSKILNGTATQALTILANGMRGGLVPRTMKWFDLDLEDKDLSKWGPARAWLDIVESKMYSIFDKSGFYSTAQSVFRELAVFGTAPVQTFSDPKNIISYRPWTAGEYVLMNDMFGRVGLGMRWFYETAENIVDLFGYEQCSDVIKNAYTRPDTKDKYYKIVNAIYPRKDFDPNKVDAMNMPFASVYWEYDKMDDSYLAESGFRIAPVMYPRWDQVSEDAYGSNCPGFDTLADNKMLQAYEKNAAMIDSKNARPPMKAPASLRGKMNMLPDGITYYDGINGSSVEPLYRMNVDSTPLQAKIQSLEVKIRNGFFNELFLMFASDNKVMTATEVAQRHEEKLAILGPVIERQNSEFLGPVIDRLFDMVMELQLVPPPPQELVGKDLKPEFVSVLAQAQKMVGAQPIERLFAFAGNMAQMDPQIMDNIDTDEAIREYGLAMGVPPKMLRDMEIVEAIRNQRNEQIRQQQMLQQAQQGANTAKMLSDAKTNDQNMLTEGGV